ncbi:hydrogen peroxide-inducible genes activator [Novosphingobium flavum]|uniref:Hydrogen peroxide-inducible genes activator n=1 Tax=Novosphingobium flavum TaxID=1778672 RepID=A0A7X1FSW2_9SPHN|nr:hydrogen peroxide-inducible genes activator [Novosphingobium flavum]MBC2665737.1 hydrogen peroxide-inducible genes activator [Novosphingobium flavum]
MLSFRQLQYLVTVADQRHFRRAASYLNVSQPTLSLQLQKLEDQLGVKLVERGNGPVHLTPIGREIVSRARQLLLDANDLEACARRGVGDLVGTISLGISPTIGPYLLPGIVGVLKQAMPELRLHIREGIPSEQAQELRRGTLDMMLTPVATVGNDLHVEPLFHEQLYLVAPPEHRLSRLPELTRADLRGSQVLSIDPRYPFHQQTQDICAELGLELLSNYEGTSLDSLCQMCASGLGLAILPELYLRSDVGGKNVVAPLEIMDWSGSRSVAALWRRNSVYSENYRKIAEVIDREASLLLKAPQSIVAPTLRV